MSRPAPTQIGIREVSRTREGRLLTLQLRSAAMGDVEPVDVLLPPHYDASGRTRYHVLYLLHGAGGDYRSWIDGKLTPLLGNLPVITVMPNGSEHGHDGNYTDWTEMPVGDSARAPAWGTGPAYWAFGPGAPDIRAVRKSLAPSSIARVIVIASDPGSKSPGEPIQGS